MLGFPPRIAGASLKLSYRTGGWVVALKISPAYCGGLIEAARLGSCATWTLAISPAYCGGLIEAA